MLVVYTFLFFLNKVKTLAVIEPPTKLVPIMKLTGKSTVSLNIRFTLDFFELFCTPIINIKKNDIFNVEM